MPVVNTNTIKEWFRNLKKPNEDQFWAWLDSFRHKWENVPLDDVEGLTSALQKKADLVNGTVPESQLPFSVKTSEVLQIGQITATENTVTVSVHSSGKNRIRLNGIVYERAYANSFSYRAVINYSKILIVYALPVVGVFFLAEGAEAPEAIEPELPEGAFVIRRIVVNQTGQIIEAPIADGIKYNEEDGWRNIMLTEPLTVLPYSYDLRSSYWIDSKIGNAVIGGIRNSLIDRNASPSWDGKEFWIYNNTGDDLPLNSATVIEEDSFLFASEITLKDKHSCKVKIRRDALEIVGVLGGSEFDPASLIATDANLQAQICAEVVERAIQDAAEVTARQNAIANEATLRANADAVKVDKPTADGTWSLQKLGSVFTWVSGVVQNIANTDLSNISARIFTQGNTFTWNTAGFFHYLKGLLDKTGNAAYTKVVVVHPTTGEMVTRDFADPAATTLAIQNTNGTQLTQIRTKIFGSTTPASPVLTEVSRQMIARNESTTTDLYGLNLTLLDPTAIYVIRPDNQQPVYAIYFANVSTTIVTTNWLFPSDMPLGDYDVKIALTSVPQGISNAKFSIVDSTTNLLFNCQNWIRKLRLRSADGLEVTPNANYNTIVRDGNIGQFRSDVTPSADASAENSTVCFKGPNILDCSLNAGWAIEIDCSMGLTGGGLAGMPTFGLTKTTDAQFTDIQKLLVHSAIYRGGNNLSNNETTPTVNTNSVGNWSFKLYIDKPKGSNTVYWRVFADSRQTMVRYTKIVEPVPYALFYKGWYAGTPYSGTYDIFTVTRFINLS